MVCALQNGVEQVERVGPLCPSSQVVPAVVWFSSETQPDGWIRLRTEARLILPATDAAAGLADLLRAAGMTVDLDPDFLTAAWRKLLVNALAGLMVLTGRRSGMFRRDDVAALSRQYLAECLAVARAEGANLDDAVIDELVGMFGAAPEDLTTSMLSDREAHRRLEWDIRNGVIARKAAQPWAGDADQRRGRAAAGRGKRRTWITAEKPTTRILFSATVKPRPLGNGGWKRRRTAPRAVSKHAAGRAFVTAAEHRCSNDGSPPNTSR